MRSRDETSMVLARMTAMMAPTTVTKDAKMACRSPTMATSPNWKALSLWLRVGWSELAEASSMRWATRSRPWPSWQRVQRVVARFLAGGHDSSRYRLGRNSQLELPSGMA
jgi:hypothetical protein